MKTEFKVELFDDTVVLMVDSEKPNTIVSENPKTTKVMEGYFEDFVPLNSRGKPFTYENEPAIEVQKALDDAELQYEISGDEVKPIEFPEDAQP